jgi:hypothetical protein
VLRVLPVTLSAMLAFACPVCGRLVTFDSTRCLHCLTELGYDWADGELVDVDGAEDRHRCANQALAACNGVAPTPDTLCESCLLTRTRPADGDADALGGFAAAEAAKRRLLFSLLELRLPVHGFREQPGGLAFDFLSSAAAPISTGHADGVITLDLTETDPAARERRRMAFGELYRTLLGHLRHEIGHYYQPILAPEGSPARERSRALFGDDRADYQEALDRHYADGPPADWARNYVSAYATMHPWEDWAETFAHYLHIRDTSQTAAAYGVRIDGPAVATTDPVPLDSDPAFDDDFRALLEAWFPLTYALNAINRSMGARDLYPFVITPATHAKLSFVDELVRDQRAARTRSSDGRSISR